VGFLAQTIGNPRLNRAPTQQQQQQRQQQQRRFLHTDSGQKRNSRKVELKAEQKGQKKQNQLEGTGFETASHSSPLPKIRFKPSFPTMDRFLVCTNSGRVDRALLGKKRLT
jgi:hypothetical protein